jgi:hypothetical protein
MSYTKFHLDKRVGVENAPTKLGLGNRVEFGEQVQSYIENHVLKGYSKTDITAKAGGGQSGATLLEHSYNNIITVVSDDDSVVLLPATEGLEQTVKNSSSNLLAVFANTSDKINGGAANGSVDIAPGGELTFRAINATDWETNENSSAFNQLATNVGAVTQTTSASTAVTLQTPAGVITTVSLTTAPGSTETFDVNNSYVTANAAVVANVHSYDGTYATNGIPMVNVVGTTTGKFTIVLHNLSVTAALNDVVRISYAIFN